MITATAILIGKIVAMILLIGAMVILLLGIGHLFHNDDLNTLEDDHVLKQDVEENEDVISEKSVFYNFLVRVTKSKKNNPDQ